MCPTVQQKFKDQFAGHFCSSGQYVEHIKQKVKQTKRSADQLWRFEACHQHNKIKRIYRNSKHFFRNRLNESTGTLPGSFDSLIHLLYSFISIFNFIQFSSNTINFNRSSKPVERLFDISRIQFLWNAIIKNLSTKQHMLPAYVNVKGKSTNGQLIHMLMVSLIFVCNVKICHANESCFGGIETFEKTALIDFNSEIKPAGTLLQQMDQALTRDCINQCKNQPICSSFGLDYTKFICAAYQYTSSQTLPPNHLMRDKLQSTNTTNFFEKVCYKGMSREEYQRICGLERLWAFERVMDAFLDGFEDLSIPSVASKEDCARHCLIETTFSCRSADFDHSTKICRLSREDRRTQPQAFRQVFASKRDYLENQCAAAGPTTCLYDTKHDTTVTTMDSLVFAENLVDCQQKCDKETTFNCRAFSLNGKKCYLSGDDTISLANSGVTSRSGFMYGEKHCVTEHCTQGVFTYEKITGHVLRTATTNPMQIHMSNVGITGHCKQFCDNNPLNCPAFQVNYLSSRCDYLDRNSQGRQLELMERDGENYFEKICLRIPSLLNSSCRDKYWIFERILGYELSHLHYDRVYEQVLSRRDCEEYCLLEKSFTCRSALYNDENAVCKLSRFDRRLKASDFIRNNNIKISYLENQCVATYSKCDYETTQNAFPTYTDLVVNFTGIYPVKDERQGKQLCENRCNESREFLCRSYAFYPATNECFISGDDTVSGYYNAIGNKNAMEYSERKCTKRNELDQMDDQVNFDDKTDTRNGDNLDDLGYRTTPVDNNSNNNRNLQDNTRQTLPEIYTTPSTVYDTSRSNGQDSNQFSPHKPNDDNYGDRDHHNHSTDGKSNDNNQRTTHYPPHTSSQFPSTRDEAHISRSNQHTVNPITLNSSKSNNRSTFFNSDGFPNNETSTYDQRSTSGYSTSIRNGPGFSAGNAKSTTPKWSSANDNRLRETVHNRNNSFDSLSLNNNKCPLNNEFTFERIPNFEPIGGQLFYLHSDPKSSAITMDCMRLCKMNVNCTGFILDYMKHSCHGIYQMYSFSKLDLRLTPGIDFFEGVCVESNRVDCDKAWMFDRIVDQNVMSNQLQPKLVLNFIDKHNCKMACLGETRFACRSLVYDLTTRECKLFDENRDSGEVQLQFTRGIEYMENQCNFFDSNACKYNSIERDLTITSITKSVPAHSTYFCEQLCDNEKEFNCRSYTYLDQTTIQHGNLCLLSADSRFTSLNGSMKYRPRALFAEKDCKDAGMRKGKKSFISEITGRNSPSSNEISPPSHQSTLNGKKNFKSGLSHQFNASQPGLANRIGSKTDQIDDQHVHFDEPAIELPNFNGKDRDCVYNEFHYEKTYGKQLRHSKRERIISSGNVLNSRGKRFIDPLNQTYQQMENLEFGESIISNVFSPTGNKKQKRNINQISQSTQNSAAMVSLTADCQDECTRRGIACRSFIVEYGPSVGTEQCFILEDAAEERTEILDYSKYGAYFEKICLREKHCSKLWTFDRVISFTLDIPARRQFQVNTKLDCEDMCLAEKKFICKSATFNYENRICKLYDENRRTRPSVFRATKMKIDYLENQCVKEPTTCQYKEQLNSELPAVDKIVQAWNLEECTHYCNGERLFNCKSVNFNHYSKECSMSSDELTSVNIINSVKFSPIMLSPKINSVYSEKGSCEHISVQCNNENMVLQLNFDSAFFGRIYSKANPSQCYLTGNGENHLDFPIPLSSTCGTRQEGAHNFINEVVIQQHAVIMTDLDKTIKVLCSFEQSDQTVTLNRNNPGKPAGLDVKTNMNARTNEIDGPSSIVTNTAAPPTIVMKILDRTGQEAQFVNLGDELMLKIEIEERSNSPFGISARNLFAKSSKNEILHLLDSDGCPIDASVFPEMKIDPVDKISLYSKFKAFRFPSTGVVNFELQIKFCPNKCDPIKCDSNSNLNQEPISQRDYYGVKSNFGRTRREAMNEFEAETLEASESKLKAIKMKNNITKEFKEFAFSVEKNDDDEQQSVPALPKPQFFQSSLQEINSTKPNPENSQQVIAQSNGIVYPSNPSDLLAYTVSYQPNQPVYKQRDVGYSNYVDPMFVQKNNHLPTHQFYTGQDFQSPNTSHLMHNNLMNSNSFTMNNVLSSPHNQFYNPFSYSHPTNGLNNFNNFGKVNPMRPMLMNENLNRNYWHPPINLEQNKPTINVPTSSIVNNNSPMNGVKFVPPRPVPRPDNQPAVPKVTEDINQLASDQEFPLSLAILVKDKDKRKDGKQANQQQSTDRRKLNLIDKKARPKASIERNSSYQSQYIEQCNTGPVILFTSLLITLIYIGLSACAYFYYTRYVKRYADQKLLVSTLNPVLPTTKVNNNSESTFAFQFPPVHRTNQLNFDNRTTSLFHSNLNGTIKSLSSSTMSNYNNVFAQNFQTKAKQPAPSTSHQQQSKSKLTQEAKLKHISNEIEKEDQLNSRKSGEFSRSNYSKTSNLSKFNRDA